MPVSDPGTSTLVEWLGTPQEAAHWLLLLLMGKAGWNLIDNAIPVRRRGVGALVVQQQQEQE
jgi:hypothetical protein